MPPITLTQIGSLIGGHGLKRDYVSGNEMAPAAKLAAMASEDQLFPDHGGFDWKSMTKSFQSRPGKEKENSRCRCKYHHTTGSKKCFSLAGQWYMAGTSEKFLKHILPK